MINSKFIILDLEWNCRPTGGRFFNEIIEIGAVKLDENLEVCGTFGQLIKPKNGRLTSTVKRITHIKNEDLAGAPGFCKAYDKFLKWAGNSEVLLCFGNSDMLVLLENLHEYGLEEKLSFVQGYADIQRYCQKRLQKDLSQLMSLSAMAELADIPTENMSMHRALDDSTVEARVFKKIYDSKTFEAEVHPNNEQLYRRLAFKPSYIVSLENPVIVRGDMRIKCPVCGSFLKRIDGWQSKNKSFRASMFCGCCKKNYFGRVRVKMEFDGVSIKSDALPEEKKEN